VKRSSPDSLLLYLLGFDPSSLLILGMMHGSGYRSAISHGVRTARTEAHGLTWHITSIIGRLLLPFLHAWLFCMLGLLALGFSTRLTFAGARFPDIYGDGSFHDAYRIVLRGETRKNGDDVNQDALYLLRRYEWRAASK
jgi:hypothetical protein